MRPLHYGAIQANANFKRGVGSYWPILVDAGNEIGDGWPSERCFPTHKRANVSQRKCVVARRCFHKGIDIGPTLGPLCEGNHQFSLFYWWANMTYIIGSHWAIV